MTQFVLAGSDSRVLLSHLALFGLGAILEQTGANPSLGWTGGMQPRPMVQSAICTPMEVAAAVHAHAARCAEATSWINRTLPDGKGKLRGVMSPRLTTLTIPEGWRGLEERRNDTIDHVTAQRAELDLRMLGALGRPAYWRVYQRQRRQDDGASRWEMQPRNQGSEFVGTRLAPLAKAVAARSEQAVHDGLTGLTPVDEINRGKADSLTPTGLSAPGPTDNALAWCALWGLSQLPLALRVREAAITSGHVGPSIAGSFHTLTWNGSWRMARLRTMLASQQAREVATSHIADSSNNDPMVGTLSTDSARSWLAARGVTAVLCFPVSRYGSDNAPERRAGLATICRLEVS
jgi:CRISPR-associated protein Csb3